MARHRTKEELQAGLDYILGSPQDGGTLECIVIRPDHGVRESLESCELSLEKGTHGDHWAKGCWMSTEDGKPHPDVQICIMNARCIEVIAGEKENWPPAGDNLFLDLDLRPENMPPAPESPSATRCWKSRRSHTMVAPVLLNVTASPPWFS